jgi:hypothetical protein
VLVAVLLILLAMTYGGAYYRLSRSGLEEAEQFGLKGFFYVPAKDVLDSQDLTRQRRWCIFFAPANWLDRQIFGGPRPIENILFRIS